MAGDGGAETRSSVFSGIIRRMSPWLLGKWKPHARTSGGGGGGGVFFFPPRGYLGINLHLAKVEDVHKGQLDAKGRLLYAQN